MSIGTVFNVRLFALARPFDWASLANFNRIASARLGGTLEPLQEGAPPASICIVGAGAAGITFALPITQEFYAGENVGYSCPPLDVDQLRYFGGTTNHWSSVRSIAKISKRRFCLSQCQSRREAAPVPGQVKALHLARLDPERFRVGFR